MPSPIEAGIIINVEKDAATQRISRTKGRQKRKHVQTNLLVNRLHHHQSLRKEYDTNTKIKVVLSDVGSSSRGNTSDTSLKLFGVKQSEVV